MSEPRRPPPPKSYVPLDLTTGPPKLPPRPTAADAGPPPNYTPPPPPMSDEEDSEDLTRREPATSTPDSYRPPPPPNPYQPRPQPQTPSTSSLPAAHGGLRPPPPSRPARPPVANTPSPDSLSLSARPHPQATSSLHQPRSKPAKRGHLEISVVSAQPMTGETVPSPTSPEAKTAPPRSLPPSVPPPSPSSQSPRVPVRRAPARPPPSRKMVPPSTKDSPPPQPASETTDGGRGAPPSPVAPPRGHQSPAQQRKPPLRKSNTLPPQRSRPPNPSHRPAPPKPAPYRGNPRPPPPQEKVDKPSEVEPRPPPPQEKVDKPSEVEPRPPPPQEKVDKPSEVEPRPPPPQEKVDKPSEVEPRPPPPQEKVDKPSEVESRPPPPQEKVDKPSEVEPRPPPPQEKVDKPSEVEPRPLPPQEKVDKPSEVEPRPPAQPPRERATDSIAEPASVESPQAKLRTKPGTVPTESREEPEKDQSREVTPPKPRRSAPKQAATSGSPPQPRPRAASASRPRFHKPPPPVEKRESPPSTRPGATPSSSALPSRPRPPPPSRPPARPEKDSEDGELTTEQVPMPKRRSQLVQTVSVEEPPEAPVPTARNMDGGASPNTCRKVEPATGETSPGINRAGEEGKTVQKRPGKPPPPRQARKSEERVPQRRMTLPSKPPPPRLTPPQPKQEESKAEVHPPPVVKRRMTVASGQGKKGEEEEGQEVVKRPTKRRSPMVIRPMLEEEEKTNSESKSRTKKPAVSSSPKPARPPGRPSAQPSRRQTKPPAEAEKIKAPPKPSQPPSPRSPRPAEGAQTQGESSSPKTPRPEEQAEENKPREVPQLETASASHDAGASERASVEITQEAKDAGAGEKESAAEERLENDSSSTTAAGEREGVVLRRKEAKQTDVVQLETYPKRARPMSMPPGRPGKPAKPAALPATAQAKNRLKPARPPARPSQGLPKPAQGPSRPSHPVKKAHTPTTPVDPSAPPELPPRPSPGHILYKYVCAAPHGIALTNHEPTDPSELPYEADDVIELIERVDRDWFYARNADLEMCEGMIPARDLRVVRKLPGESTVSGFEEGPCAVATFTFQGQTMDELSFKEGDLIMLKTRVGAEWLRGKLVGGKEGIFPRTYVEIVEDLPADAVEEVPAATQSQSTAEIHGPHCVAVYEFTAGGPDELNLSVGDTVELLARVGSEWLRGRLGGQEGIFPGDFVEIREDLPPAESQTDSLSTALYDFDGQQGELSFKAGEKVRVVARVNEEWVEGEVEEGRRRGIFPSSFVDRLPAELPRKSDPTEAPQPAKSVVTGKCEALFDFTTENAGELSFKTGDAIVTLEWVNEEWMNGRIGDREGMFPVSFVKVLEELPKPREDKDSSKDPLALFVDPALTHLTKLDDSLLPRAEALRDFTATDSHHLCFRAGDVLNLLDRIGGNWYSGENTRTGGFGDFPASHVRVIEPLP